MTTNPNRAINSVGQVSKADERARGVRNICLKGWGSAWHSKMYDLSGQNCTPYFII
jgi:hypothetical protein